MPFVVGVAGGSGSGKTTVARALRTRLGEERVAVVPHDAYYRGSDAHGGDPQAYNFDHPEALDNALLAEHLAALRRGETIERPVYDFTLHERTGETVPVPPLQVVVVEGVLLLAVEQVRPLLDLKVFVDTDPDLRFIRRLKRDMRDRGRSPLSVIEQYLGSVRPMHQSWVEPSRVHADLLIHEGGKNELAISEVAARIEERLKL